MSGYHLGASVQSGIHAATALSINAPDFAGSRWKAERDGSIRPEPGHVACEFVSPILHGGEGSSVIPSGNPPLAKAQGVAAGDPAARASWIE